MENDSYTLFFVGSAIKYFFLLTPFFAVSVFLTLTKGLSGHQRRQMALKSSVAMVFICMVLFFFGNYIFRILGITVDSFRVGAGVLLFLLAIDSTRGRKLEIEKEGDISVVPIAVPVTVGPGTIGTILVMGSESVGFSYASVGCLALVMAILAVGIMFWFAHELERFISNDALAVLSKLTGLVLAAFSAQLILVGIRNLLS